MFVLVALSWATSFGQTRVDPFRLKRPQQRQRIEAGSQVAGSGQVVDRFRSPDALKLAEASWVEAQLQLLEIEFRLMDRTPSPWFFKGELKFPPLKAPSPMLSTEQVQRTCAPFPETVVIRDPAFLARRPDLEKRKTRP